LGRFSPGTCSVRGLPRVPIDSTTRWARYVDTVLRISNAPSGARATVSTDSPLWTWTPTRSISSCQIGISCSFDESKHGRNE
jgi:hypothetical protein